MITIACSFQTVFALPDGEVIWPGTVVDPARPTNGMTQDAPTFQALAAVHDALDDMPEELRRLATNFMEATKKYISDQYAERGTESLIIRTPDGNIEVISRPAF
jgi:hypothetical protein